MAKLFNGGDGEQGCPGQENCETWLSSAEPKFCPSCPKRQRSEVRGQRSDGELGTRNSELETDSIVDEVERIVSERDSGFGLPPDLTPLEKELVIIWDQYVAAHERAHQQRVAQIIEQMITRAG